jgi:hypothetical protein
MKNKGVVRVTSKKRKGKNTKRNWNGKGKK